MAIVQVQELIESGVHFGHRASRWNPKMRPYIYGKRNLIHIIDLRETVRGLLRAYRFLAKVASELDKPDGMTVVPPGTELDLLRPMKVTVIPGVGPATAERLRRAGIHTIAELERVSQDELVRLLGNAHGHGLWQLARARDDRPVVAERETKSVSVEGTYDADLTDRKLMEGLLTRQAKAA